ncbi:MAG: hypothetical protein GXO58_03570 [Thermodesulfobacteria bacterium]|nr:hypothetical protein [Thermodesulfobacteriota bacterium]
MQKLNILPLNFADGEIPLKNGSARLLFQITLGCGCPTCAGGRFDPQRFHVRVELYNDKNGLAGTFQGKYTGDVSQFASDITDVSPGHYLLEINATDPESGAAGRLNMNVNLV